MDRSAQVFYPDADDLGGSPGISSDRVRGEGRIMQTCPIWGETYQVKDIYHEADRRFVVLDSARAGGSYTITNNEKRPLAELTDAEKARLTTLLIDQRRSGTPLPAVTMGLIERAKRKHPLEPSVRADRLLRHLADMSETVGHQVRAGSESPAAYAWSESTHPGEILYLIRYLQESGWMHGPEGWASGFLGTVTVDGYRRIEEQQMNPDSRQAFVAMWFHDTMDRAFEVGIKPGIEDAGYNALRVDRTEYIHKIDDEIIAGIRRSRFLVADWTQADDGARGGVYYEAGFAAGLAIPVIYTCRNGGVDDLAFDTRQYNHILWETPEELRKALRDRIGRVIGDGPGATA